MWTLFTLLENSYLRKLSRQAIISCVWKQSKQGPKMASFEKIMNDAFQDVMIFLRAVRKIELCLDTRIPTEPKSLPLSRQFIQIRLLSDCYLCSDKLCSLSVGEYLEKSKYLPFQCMHWKKAYGEIMGSSLWNWQKSLKSWICSPIHKMKWRCVVNQMTRLGFLCLTCWKIIWKEVLRKWNAVFLMWVLMY